MLEEQRLYDIFFTEGLGKLSFYIHSYCINIVFLSTVEPRYKEVGYNKTLL